MTGVMEPAGWIAAIVAAAGLVLFEGHRQHELESKVPLTARELYAVLARSKVQLQIFDVRGDLEAGFEDTHIPGAIPLPDCDPSKAPSDVAARLLPSVPAVIVSAEGDEASFAACRERFTSARNLEGGMTAWSDANYPEDSGEYVPPRASTSGGCL